MNSLPPKLFPKWKLAFKQWRNQSRIARRDSVFGRRAAAFENYWSADRLKAIVASDHALTFSHAGNAGDVIYALPAMRALARGRPAALVLKVGLTAFYAEGVHPLGNVRMDDRTARMLIPLLSAQDYVQRCEIDDGSATVDWALDTFRDAPIPGDKGHIARWPFYVSGVSCDLSQSWLDVPPLSGLDETILIARSQRYRNPHLDHRFLARYRRLAFIGVDAEFKDMRRQLPNLQRIEVTDFFHLASAIKGSRLFIGNQSFPFAIAEALKIPRVLEACHRTPNVVPHGPRAHDVYFQGVFEWVVHRLNEGDD